MSAASAPPDLLALRGELDRIDDALHDLLMQRAAIVTRVGALRAKGPVALRPGREAAILRRLRDRNRPPLDLDTLLRVWRDILNGSTAQQQSMRIAVAAPGLIPLVRQHFGAQARIDIVATEDDALDGVRTGRTPVAVLRWPGAWWATLQHPDATPKIVARLPFWGDTSQTAMIVTAADPDPSGHDRTLLALPPGARSDHEPAAPAGPDGRTLIELDGFLQPGAPAMAALPGGTTIVGAYAVPVGEGA